MPIGNGSRQKDGWTKRERVRSEHRVMRKAEEITFARNQVKIVSPVLLRAVTDLLWAASTAGSGLEIKNPMAPSSVRASKWKIIRVL